MVTYSQLHLSILLEISIHILQSDGTRAYGLWKRVSKMFNCQRQKQSQELDVTRESK